MADHTSTAESEYLNSSHVRARYDDISDMTLHRWIKRADLGFPTPIYICRKRYWARNELERWEECQLIKRLMPRQASNG